MVTAEALWLANNDGQAAVALTPLEGSLPPGGPASATASPS